MRRAKKLPKRPVEHVRVRLDNGRAVVQPGAVTVRSGQEISVTNRTSYPIDVFVPRARFNERIARRASRRFSILEPGRYVYAVYCEETEEFAAGNSSPIIIIK